MSVCTVDSCKSNCSWFKSIFVLLYPTNISFLLPCFQVSNFPSFLQLLWWYKLPYYVINKCFLFCSFLLYSKPLRTGPLKFIHSAAVPPLSETSKLEMFGISAMQPSRIWEPPERNWKDTRTRLKTHRWVCSAQWPHTIDAQLAFIFCHKLFLHWQKCTLQCLLLCNKSKDLTL